MTPQKVPLRDRMEECVLPARQPTPRAGCGAAGRRESCRGAVCWVDGWSGGRIQDAAERIFPDAPVSLSLRLSVCLKESRRRP